MEDNKQKVGSNEISSVMGINLGVTFDKRILSWLAAIAAELVVAAVVIFVFYLPQMTEWEKLNKEIKKQETLLESKRDKVKMISDLEAVIGEAEDTLELALPPNKDIGLLLASLRQQSALVGVRIDTYALNPGEVSTAENKAKNNKNAEIDSGLPIELTVSGQIDNLRRFLDIVNTSLPIKKVDNVQVVSSEDRQQTKLKLEMVMYFMHRDEKQVESNPLRMFTQGEMDLLRSLSGYASYNQQRDAVDVPLGNNDLFGM
ncbi:hypothetical protein A2368_02515 [Candidatus Collierbacteria bacterium RIFOXYB1_FULL_49_13]|uniref:Pilus assembly protein PilO n=1 Tax=Candidatus Collierbacteria bacterium RIFOXYB1_FULL_49_13 TaxID=1817728 RepID=A0A1F5FK28_9BACT|nr:MAG: hypothetical protein A2368_02515 [Candidatus Collierbacteria bacterium RIFOXYB1_FULL_49_13]